MSHFKLHNRISTFSPEAIELLQERADEGYISVAADDYGCIVIIIDGIYSHPPKGKRGHGMRTPQDVAARWAEKLTLPYNGVAEHVSIPEEVKGDIKKQREWIQEWQERQRDEREAQWAMDRIFKDNKGDN